MHLYFGFILLFLLLTIKNGLCVRSYNRNRLKHLKLEVKEMFEHAYFGYMNHAYPFDELRPLTCDGVDTWGSYSLSLIDALDTLIVMGHHDEFNKAVEYLKLNVTFDADINVSVFETNIRVVGGLLSAHILSHRASKNLEMGWPCNGPLLRMAEDVARKLLPAFDTPTGMPYGTVNLRSGVPKGETTVTCTAGVGTFIIEFGTLSRLTGDSIFEEVALRALYSLFQHKSKIGLMGNHLDVATGQWIAHDSGIGGGIDSYFEYLVKGSLLFNMPNLRSMFDELKKSIDKYSMTAAGWYFWVSMNKGQITMPVYQSLDSYWPGLLSLIGDIDSAMKTISNYHDVLKIYGFIPEVYNVLNQDAVRDSFPLRPELIESAMYLYKATQGDPYLLDIGSDLLRSIQHSSRTRCGYATIKNCKHHTLQNRMESFFLAETTKYLYLLFDPDNFIHNDGSHGKVWKTAGGRECIIDAGGYIFNTEAHPIDPGILHCCYTSHSTEFLSKRTNENTSYTDTVEKDEIHINNEDLELTGHGVV
ncbi:ER degradation-enhancing alpha-mannosidase-like protein 2 isoform X2 [Daktulosphaira vitifoliae]|uniref:ER degradation-enhancing alpha-mannosidase-like protein 2 isoform X2 n=1 Tax=Daktulosphaira vitifoliae TaxID=58002 RepID=UPI0021AA04A2|nr:ER degradation-enhancing alpha-mannosidase-like protein 2 isoform X2 [Daktulosphaira vitifoliae]